MEIGTGKVSIARIGASPPGRGMRARPRKTVNADYVRRLLEERRLTKRDELLLQFLDEVGVLSSRQIKMMLWHDVSWANLHRRLRKLYDYYLLDRARMLNRTEGITYTLGKAGRIWLHGSARGGEAPRVNERLLAHELGVSEVLVLFRRALEMMDYDGRWGLRLGWLNKQHARIVKGDKMILEPDAFFYYYSVGGEREIRGGYFLEMDMGTMTGPVFAGKARRYQRAVNVAGWKKMKQRSGIDLADTAVIVLTTSLERARNLAKKVAGVWGVGGREEAVMWLFNALKAVSDKGFYGRSDWIVVTRAGNYYEGFRLSEPVADSAALYRQGEVWYEQENLELAAYYYQKSIQADSNFAEAHFGMGNIMYIQEEWAEAAAAYSRAIERRPGFDVAYYNRARMYTRLGKLSAAIADYRQVTALNAAFAAAEKVAARIRILERKQREMQAAQSIQGAGRKDGRSGR